MHDSNITFNLEVHPKYGFYEIKNGMKCEFMELDGFSMRCNQDAGVFKKGKIYAIHHNSNDHVVYDNKEARIYAIKNENLDENNEIDWLHIEYGFYESVSVERFEDGTFTLISGS